MSFTRISTLSFTFFVLDRNSGFIVSNMLFPLLGDNVESIIVYYYCEAGSTKMYSEMPAYNTYIKEYEEDYSVLPSDYNKPDHKKTLIWETEKYGSGKYQTRTFPIQKFEWRINNDQISILTDCGIGDKCMNKSRFGEKTLPNGKAALEFDGFIFIQQKF